MGLFHNKMEDKWFIYYENEWLLLLSFGQATECIKQKLNKETDGYSIREFWREERKKKIEKKDDNTDIEILGFLM